MNNTVLDLNVLSLLLAYVFVVLLLILVRSRGIRREKEILVASLRMTLQLVAMGYVLLFVFKNPSPLLTLPMLLIMEGFAVYTAISRSKTTDCRPMRRAIALSMVCGSVTTLVYFLFVVIAVRPWYNPQYVIPIAGMILGNSMTGVTLGANRLICDMRDKRAIVENSLMLGATPAAATREIANGAFDAAIMPTINTMLGMGIISLPGMMTGQILSGTLPTTAIKYQIGIMLAILGSVSISVILLVTLGCRTFFNEKKQLI